MRNACKVLIIQDGKYLLLKRSEDHPHFKGLWDFPGGRQDEGETLEQTLIREVKEETTLDIVQNKIAKDFEFVNEEFDIHFFIYSLRSYTGKIILSHEHDEFAWYSEEEIRKLNLHPSVKMYFE